MVLSSIEATEFTNVVLLKKKMTEKHGSLNNAYTCTLIMYINSPTDGDVSRYQIEGDST